MPAIPRGSAEIAEEGLRDMDYLKIGSYTPPDNDGKGEKIIREFYGQGMIFKSDEAFYDTEHPDRVCYIPEF